jgi:uncharacterized protein
LPLLLEAYAIVDAGIHEAIRREEKQGRALACHKGCAACCRSHTTIPVYPLELIGINWYVVEKITGPLREQLKIQLRDHKKGEPCPLLMDNACTVHPLRPMACRQFNVFDKVCTEGGTPITRAAPTCSPRSAITPTRPLMCCCRSMASRTAVSANA